MTHQTYNSYKRALDLRKVQSVVESEVKEEGGTLAYKLDSPGRIVFSHDMRLLIEAILI